MESFESKGYTPQTLVAEKLESILRLGLANTRMKDFYDIWMVLQQFSFEQGELFPIVKKVFNERETEIKGLPIAFSSRFYRDPRKLEEWKGFLKGVSQEEVSLEKVVLDIKMQFEGLFSIEERQESMGSLQVSQKEDSERDG